MTRISESNDGGIIIAPTHSRDTILDESDLREIIAWTKKNKPEILRDIMCEDCPEVEK